MTQTGLILCQWRLLQICRSTRVLTQRLTPLCIVYVLLPFMVQRNAGQVGLYSSILVVSSFAPHRPSAVFLATVALWVGRAGQLLRLCSSLHRWTSVPKIMRLVQPLLSLCLFFVFLPVHCTVHTFTYSDSPMVAYATLHSLHFVMVQRNARKVLNSSISGQCPCTWQAQCSVSATVALTYHLIGLLGMKEMNPCCTLHHECGKGGNNWQSLDMEVSEHLIQLPSS